MENKRIINVSFHRETPNMIKKRLKALRDGVGFIFNRSQYLESLVRLDCLFRTIDKGGHGHHVLLNLYAQPQSTEDEQTA